MVPLDSVSMAGPIGWFNAESGVRRGFCTQCGTTLFSERQSANTIGLTMGSLDEPDLFEPTEHIWTRSEEHTSELQSLMRISYAVFCLKKKKKTTYISRTHSSVQQRYHNN